jgi:hypothetical protein
MILPILKVKCIQPTYCFNSSPTAPTSSYKPFPELLANNCLPPDSNTTLPHPSADTSPNACIESADVPVSRTHTRHSSFQLPRIGGSRPKARGPLASGLISPADGLPNGIPWADGNNDQKGLDELAQSAALTTGQLERRAEEEESGDQRAGRDHGEEGHREGERKKGLLRKLHLH